MTVNLNGDTTNWTLGSVFTSPISSQILADMFRWYNTSTGAVIVRRSTEVPHRNLCGGRTIPYSLEVEVTTAKASPGALDVAAVTYRGEGSELCRMGEQAIRVRGWLWGPIGTYNFHVSNGPETVSYSYPVVITAQNMWNEVEFWTTRMPDWDGSWYTNYRVGYTVALTLMGGTGVQDEMEKWVSGLKFGTTPSNFMATVGNKVRIAGLRIGEGPILQEVAESTETYCMRYHEKSADRDTPPTTGLGWGTGELTWRSPVAGAGAPLVTARQQFVAPKRKAPFMAVQNPAAANTQARCFTAAADCTGTTIDSITSYGFRLQANLPVAAAANELIGAHWTANASLPGLTLAVGS